MAIGRTCPIHAQTLWKSYQVGCYSGLMGRSARSTLRAVMHSRSISAGSPSLHVSPGGGCIGVMVTFGFPPASWLLEGLWTHPCHRAAQLAAGGPLAEGVRARPVARPVAWSRCRCPGVRLGVRTSSHRHRGSSLAIQGPMPGRSHQCHPAIPRAAGAPRPRWCRQRGIVSQQPMPRRCRQCHPPALWAAGAPRPRWCNQQWCGRRGIASQVPMLRRCHRCHPAVPWAAGALRPRWCTRRKIVTRSASR